MFFSIFSLLCLMRLECAHVQMCVSILQWREQSHQRECDVSIPKQSCWWNAITTGNLGQTDTASRLMGTVSYHSSFAFTVLNCPQEEQDWVSRVTPPAEHKAVGCVGGVILPWAGHSTDLPWDDLLLLLLAESVQLLESEGNLFLDLHRHQHPWILRHHFFLITPR